MKRLGSIGSLILLFIFLCSAVMLVILCITTYESIIKSQKEQLEMRTSVQCLANNIRKSDCRDAINIKRVENISVLVCAKQDEAATYETWIYEYKGSLCQISKHQTEKFKPREGKRISKIASLSIGEIVPSLIKVEVKDEFDLTHTYIFTVRSSQNVVQDET